MISVVSTVSNAKFDADQLVRFLHHWNDYTTFEVILVHEDVVEDGSWDVLVTLEKEFGNVRRVGSGSKVDLNPESMGVLRLPVSWLPAFKLKELDTFMEKGSVDGYLHTKLAAARLDVSNQGVVEVQRQVVQRKRQQDRGRYLGPSLSRYPALAREYDLRSEDIHFYLLIDPRDNSTVALDSENFLTIAQSVISDLSVQGDRRYLPRRVEAMTRKAWDLLEEDRRVLMDAPLTLAVIMLRPHESIRASSRACLGVDALALRHPIPKRHFRLR